VIVSPMSNELAYRDEVEKSFSEVQEKFQNFSDDSVFLSLQLKTSYLTYFHSKPKVFETLTWGLIHKTFYGRNSEPY
jgi:hypothetical protein